MSEEKTYIYGRHAVIEAIKKRPDVVRAVFVREDLLSDTALHRTVSKIEKVSIFTGNDIPRGIDKHAVHQGLIAEIVLSKLIIPFKEFREGMLSTPETAFVLLGELDDPHNVGAIIRSAAAFGMTGVLIPEHRQAPITGTVIKVSAGMAFTIPLISVGNVNSTIRDLKERGFWVYGLDSSGDTNLHEETFERPSVFIVGNEGKGIREKTRALCDSVLTIPMHPRTESLNASVSAAVVAYAWSTKHSGIVRKSASPGI